MENNKYNNYYSRKTVSELITELRLWKQDSSKADWYEALKIHLSERELSNDERQQADYIINTDITKLIKEEKNEKIEAISTEKSKTSIPLPLNNELDLTRKFNNINEILEKSNKLIEQKLELVGDTIIAINTSMLTRAILLILLGIFNAIMFGILKNNLGNIGDMNQTNDSTSAIIALTSIVDFIVFFILIIIEFSIIGKFKTAGEQLKKN